MPTIRFADRSIECPVGANLRVVLLRAQVPLYTRVARAVHCRGHGTCGTCAVRIEGPISEPTPAELRRLKLPPHNLDAGLRLACQCNVLGDVEVVKYDGLWGQHVPRGAGEAPAPRSVAHDVEAVEAVEELDALAATLFAAIEGGDLETVRELYAPDVEVWHNVSSRAQTRDENLDLLREFTGRVSKLRYEVLARDFFPGGFVQRHVLHGQVASGEAIDAAVCLVVYVSRGRIERLYEYLDPRSVKAAFA